MQQNQNHRNVITLKCMKYLLPLPDIGYRIHQTIFFPGLYLVRKLKYNNNKQGK